MQKSVIAALPPEDEFARLSDGPFGKIVVRIGKE
jgi:hypothetical protein